MRAFGPNCMDVDVAARVFMEHEPKTTIAHMLTYHRYWELGKTQTLSDCIHHRLTIANLVCRWRRNAPLYSLVPDIPVHGRASQGTDDTPMCRKLREGLWFAMIAKITGGCTDHTRLCSQSARYKMARVFQ